MTELEEILTDLCDVHNRILNYGQDMLAEQIGEIIDRLEYYIEEKNNDRNTIQTIHNRNLD